MAVKATFATLRLDRQIFLGLALITFFQSLSPCFCLPWSDFEQLKHAKAICYLLIFAGQAWKIDWYMILCFCCDVLSLLQICLPCLSFVTFIEVSNGCGGGWRAILKVAPISITWCDLLGMRTIPSTAGTFGVGPRRRLVWSLYFPAVACSFDVVQRNASIVQAFLSLYELRSFFLELLYQTV